MTSALPGHYLTRILFSLAVVAALATGCGKGNGGKRSGTVYYPATVTEVKTQTGVGEATSKFTFVYDGSHRVLSKSADFDPGMHTTYSYATGSYTEDSYVNGTLATHTTYLLNNLPLVDSFYQIDIPDNDTLAAKFLYDDHKQLTRQKQYYYTSGYGSLLYNSINYAYDSSGNLLTATDGYKVISNSYPGSNFNAVSLGLIYMQQLPQLPDMVNVAQSDGVVTSSGHVYTYDASGRLVTDTEQQSGGTSIIRTYTY